MKSIQQPKIDPNTLRYVAGAFATGVTIVTTKKADGSIHGMTANSFLSVSLDPPLILFSVMEDGSLMDYLELGKDVGISILSEKQMSISNKFAGINGEDLDVEFVSKGNIQLIKGAIAWYHTQVKEIIPAGDHFLILCDIVDLAREEGSDPILYYSGYRKIGDIL